MIKRDVLGGVVACNRKSLWRLCRWESCLKVKLHVWLPFLELSYLFTAVTYLRSIFPWDIKDRKMKAFSFSGITTFVISLSNSAHHNQSCFQRPIITCQNHRYNFKTKWYIAIVTRILCSFLSELHDRSHCRVYIIRNFIWIIFAQYKINLLYLFISKLY